MAAAVLSPQAPAHIVAAVSTYADGFGRWCASVTFVRTLSESDTRPQFNVAAQLRVIRRAARKALLTELLAREQKTHETEKEARTRLSRSLRLEIAGHNIDSLNRWHGMTFREA